MGDLHEASSGAGFRESGANETVEKQRVLSLLLNPGNKYRLTQDFYYTPEEDSRLNPKSEDFKPFADVVAEDWQQFIAEQKPEKVSIEEFEREWLSPLPKEQIAQAIQQWIGESKTEEQKTAFTAYKERFLASVDDYERQRAAQELAKTPVAANSRLYRDYADGYFSNNNNVQDRYANVKDYLRAVLVEMQNGSMPLPSGCKTPDEILSPFWQTQNAETKNHNQVFLGSRLGLEYGTLFYDNPQSKMLSHVSENLPAGKRRYSGSQLEAVSLGDIYGSLRDFIKQAADRMEAGEINLPEGAKNLADALRPLTQEEAEQWFLEQGIAESHPFKKFLSTGVMASEQMPADAEVEVGSDEDLAHHQERWQKQASRPVNYQQPPDSGDVEVSESVAKEFGYKKGDVGREGRAFRAEVAANLRDLKFEPLRQDGVLRMSCTVDVNEQGTLRPKSINIYVNLPKEAIAAYGEDPGAVQQVLADLLRTNESSKHPDLIYNAQADRLEIGLGDDEHLNVIVSMSTKDMRQAVPDMAEEVNDYVVRKQARILALDERQKMWRFENELLKTWQKNSNGQEVELRQKIWDEAFLKLFRQKIGEQKFAELGTLPMPPVYEPIPVRQESRPTAQNLVRQANILGNKNRFAQVREFMDNPEFQQQAAKFVKAIKKEFSGWQEFLNYAGNILAIAQSKNVGLESAPAYVILGKEVLGAPERANQLKEYEALSRLSLGEILGRNLFNLPEGSKVNKQNILRNILLKYIQENPLPSDKWEKSGRTPETGQSVNRNIRQEPSRARPASPERQPIARDNHSDILAKILARAEKRANSRPYNPEDDPEIQAGII